MAIAKRQVETYKTVNFFQGLATNARKIEKGFEVSTSSAEIFRASKLIFATGIKDILPAIDGFAECFGISILHCPYCHGYEVANRKTGILGNGDSGVEFAGLISNWTADLTLYTNGKSSLTEEQTAKLESHNIKIIETPIASFKHAKGYVNEIIFDDGSTEPIEALYARNPFEQHCSIPKSLGCEITEDGYIKVDAAQKTTVDGVFACGDNSSRMRSLASAVAAGTAAGAMVNRELIFENF
jgi:thioredoxin reductase